MKKSKAYLMAERGLVSVAEASRRAGMAQSALHRWIKIGKVACSEFMGRPCFSASDLEHLQATARVTPKVGCRPVQVTPELVAEMKRLRALGYRHPDICARLGCSGPTVSKCLKGFSHGPHRGALKASPEKVRAMARRWWWGESFNGIARDVGLSSATVAYHCKRNPLPVIKFL